jgi:hypothetical protein
MTIEVSTGKKFVRPHLTQWLGVVVPVWGSTDRRVVVQAGQGIKARPYLKNNQCRKGWWHDSSGRVPASQV